VRGNVNKEVQQPPRPPRSQHTARPQGEAQPKASLHNAPMVDLREKINDGRDARHIIKARKKHQLDRYHDADDSDRFPVFTSNITDRSYPKDFKLVGIPKW
jgi:hypothetical protein